MLRPGRTGANSPRPTDNRPFENTQSLEFYSTLGWESLIGMEPSKQNGDRGRGAKRSSNEGPGCRVRTMELGVGDRFVLADMIGFERCTNV